MHLQWYQQLQDSNSRSCYQRQQPEVGPGKLVSTSPQRGRMRERSEMTDEWAKDGDSYMERTRENVSGGRTGADRDNSQERR